MRDTSDYVYTHRAATLAIVIAGITTTTIALTPIAYLLWLATR